MVLTYSVDEDCTQQVVPHTGPYKSNLNVVG